MREKRKGERWSLMGRLLHGEMVRLLYGLLTM